MTKLQLKTALQNVQNERASNPNNQALIEKERNLKMLLAAQDSGRVIFVSC
jgi:hypothetical protein